MRDHTYIDTKARRAFEERIKGLPAEVLARVLDGGNDAGWWRSRRIRAAWRELTALFRPESHSSIRQQYCG